MFFLSELIRENWYIFVLFGCVLSLVTLYALYLSDLRGEIKIEASDIVKYVLTMVFFITFVVIIETEPFTYKNMFFLSALIKENWYIFVLFAIYLVSLSYLYLKWEIEALDIVKYVLTMVFIIVCFFTMESFNFCLFLFMAVILWIFDRFI